MRILERGISPKYFRLAEQLRRQIETGQLQPGARVPSFAEMKKQHGVSQTTMEKMYLLLEEQGLVVRVQGRGTFVAEPPERQKTGAIGVVIDTRHYQNPYYSRILHGIQKVAKREGVEILLLHEQSAVKWARADGVLLLTLIEARLQIIPPTMPCATLLLPQANLPHIGINDYQGEYTAVEHLLSLGHRRIAYLVGHGLVFGERMIFDERVRGYRRALRAAGVKVSPDWIRSLKHRDEIAEEPFFYHCGRASMQNWLEDGWRDLGCTALLAQNDETAIGAIEAIQEAGLSVPNDVSVVGFDGGEAAEFFRPRLTTMEVPLEEIGVAGAECLLRQIRGTEEIDDVTLPVQLRVGDSTAPLQKK